MKMKLTWEDSKSLTSACRDFMKVKSNVKGSYINPRNGDTAYTVLDKNSMLYLEFYLKENPRTGEKYVNWARINGSDKDVNQFLVAAKSVFAAAETAKDFVEPEF